MTTPTTNHSFPKPIRNADAGTWGDSLNTCLDMIDGLIPLSSAFSTSNLNLASNTGVSATLTFINGTVPVGQQKRWVLGEDTASEGGGNAGSNFSISAYNDTGALLSTPMAFTRSTGAVTFGTPATFTGAATFGSYLNVTGSATLNTLTATGAATFGSTLGVTGTTTLGGALNVAGAATLTNNLIVGSKTLILGSGNGLSVGNNGVICENNLAVGNVLSVNRTTSNGVAVSFLQNTVSCGSITVANNNATAFNTTSDARLKTDAQSFDAGSIIDAINVYNFEWTNSRTRAYGVMAQEAADVFPDAVHHNEIDDTWGIDYSKFVPLLLNEIKALRTRVAELEAKAR